MSLIRTALRLCVIEALKGVTLAGLRVYDSRMDDISPETFADDARAIALVMTDKDEGEAQSAQNGGPPFFRNTELSIEMGMVVRIKSEGAEDIIDYPDTDARLEAALDLFEFQIIRCLQYSDNQLPIVFRRFWRITKYDCHRQVLDDTGVRIASRILMLTCLSGDDQVKIYNASGTIPTGYGILSEPLRTIANLLPVGSSGRNICDLIVAASTNLVVPEFTGIDTTVDGGNAVEGDVPSTEFSGTIDVETLPP